MIIDQLKQTLYFRSCPPQLCFIIRKTHSTDNIYFLSSHFRVWFVTTHITSVVKGHEAEHSGRRPLESRSGLQLDQWVSYEMWLWAASFLLISLHMTDAAALALFFLPYVTSAAQRDDCLFMKTPAPPPWTQSIEINTLTEEDASRDHIRYWLIDLFVQRCW